MREVIINGKFLCANMTGVHRVAAELIKGVFALVAERPELGRSLQLALWVPRNGAANARAMGLGHVVVRPLTGNAWEQISLPWLARGRLVLSLCNVGPIATSNAITMYHDAQVRITPESYRWSFRAWYRLHQWVGGFRHRRILTVSDYSRRQLAAYGIARPDRIGVVQNGADHVLATLPDVSVIDRLALCAGRYVLALANVQAHKNIGVLLDAFADSDLRPDLKDITLVLFGSATRADFVRAGYTVAPGVIFAGRVSDGELVGLYAHAACLAYPSTTEGFGLPPLEAMLAGCPALVAPAGALPEVCGDAALYVDPHRPQAWALAIAGLIDNPAERARLAALGLAHAAAFTWRAAASRLLDEILSYPE